jgi:hypothetical protein
MEQAFDGHGQGTAAADRTSDLGARILAAAKLAASMHLYQSTLPQTSTLDRQQVTIGGAGPTWVTDDALPATAPRRAAGRRE